MSKRKINSETVRQIQKLREQGYSLPEISKTLNIPKTTVFRYIQNVRILSQHLAAWSIKRGGSRKRKMLKEYKALEEAKNSIGKLSDKEKVLFLSALYWAEGSKRDFGLSNTDPSLIRIFINGLRELFAIPNDRFRISVRLYEDLDINTCLSFWSEVVNMPKESFIGVNILLGKKTGKLKYGMCRVRVAKGGDLLKKINGINKVVSESFVPIA